MASDLFAFLDETVHVAVLDDDPIVLDTICGYFGLCPLCVVHPYYSASQVVDAFCGGAPAHALFMDMGICDIDADEHYLIRTFADRLPIICISGRRDSKAGFEAAALGALGFLDKGKDVSFVVLLTWLRDAILWSLARRTCVGERRPTTERAIQTLVERRPATVAEWAGAMGITESHLREVWTSCCFALPKHLVFLVRLYTLAFDYRVQTQLNMGSTGIGKRDEVSRMRRYYGRNQPGISRILNLAGKVPVPREQYQLPARLNA